MVYLIIAAALLSGVLMGFANYLTVQKSAWYGRIMSRVDNSDHQPLLHWIWEERAIFRVLFLWLFLFTGSAYYAQERFEYSAIEAGYFSLSIMCTLGEVAVPEDASDGDFVFGIRLFIKT